MQILNAKTNWQEGEAFLLDVDYARIQTNMAIACALAQSLYHAFTTPSLPTAQANAWVHASFFNGVEQGIVALAEATVPENGAVAKTFAPNDRIWTAQDLNRIEAMQQLLYTQLQGQKAMLPTLQFTLKGSVF